MIFSDEIKIDYMPFRSSMMIFPAYKNADLVKPRQMNVIYILADDLGYGDIGCYGQKKK